jgi:hypothetical protein
LGEPARIQLALLDPRVAREFGIVAASLLDEVVGDPPLRMVRADAARTVAVAACRARSLD